MPRDGFRDGYNPYRDERREEPRRHISLTYGRERSFSPSFGGPAPGSRFTPPQGRGFGGLARADDEGNETIPIESSLVGLIIGRQGENLRRVEASTSTRVQFITGPEESGPMRQCKISGNRTARENAKTEIFRIIEENGNGPSASGRAPPPADRNMNVGGGMSKVAGMQQPALRPGEDTSQIMVPNRTVGLIIGRGGETIRDLQERSACHVNIVGEEKSVNGLRPVNLIGTPQAAAMAKDLIMEIVESDTKSLAAKGGDPRDRGGPAFGGGDGEKINDKISVPSEAVGMIIGKGPYPVLRGYLRLLTFPSGGETIKDMQANTGCKINVSPAAGQDFERDIGLVGSRDSIERAKNAIMEKVHAVVSLLVPLVPKCLTLSPSKRRTAGVADHQTTKTNTTTNHNILNRPISTSSSSMVTNKTRSSSSSSSNPEAPLEEQIPMQRMAAMRTISLCGILAIKPRIKASKTPKLKVPQARDVIRDIRLA